MIEVVEFAPALRGLWRLDVYEGDVVRDRRGRVRNRQVDEIVAENLVVTQGKNITLDRLFGLSGVAALSRIGVGTSNTAAALGDTTLTGGVYVAFDSTPTRSGSAVTAVGTFGTGVANIVWAELSLETPTSLCSRLAPIGPITKSAALSIVCTVSLTAS